MKTRAAVIWDVGQEWKIEEVNLDDPGPGEVLVRTRAAGMCHSDEHIVTGDLAFSNEMAAAMIVGLTPAVALVVACRGVLRSLVRSQPGQSGEHRHPG